jgi:hypothetical protein
MYSYLSLLMLRHSIGSVGDELMDGYEATKEGAAPVGTAAARVEVVAAEIQGIRGNRGQ